MIIDTHCHVHKYPEHWSEYMANIYMESGVNKKSCWLHPGEDWKPEYLDIDNEFLVKELDEANVDKAFLLAQYWEPYKCITPNDYVKELAQKYPNKFVPFAAVNPIGGTKAVKELELYVERYNFKGLKLSPIYNHVRANDSKIYPLYSKAEELGIPVLIHIGWTRPPKCKIKDQDPLQIDDIASAFPSLRIIVAHIGFHRAFDVIMLMKKYPNLYGDLAYFQDLPKDFIARVLVFAKKAGIINRIFWGTDYPWICPKDGISFYRSMPDYVKKLNLEPLVTKDDIENVLGNNAAHMMNLK